MQNRSNYGHPMIASGVALTVTLMKAIDVTQNLPYEEFICADGTRWLYHPSSTLTGDDVLVISPTTGAGKYLRMPGGVTLQLPISFALADAAVLLTMQAGQRMVIRELAWRIVTTFAGGSSSAIGVSSNKTTPTNWSTKGDLLGGSAGDLTATLVSTAVGGMVAGTIGVDFDTIAKRRGAIWVAADTLRYDAITSLYTSGAGFVVVTVDLITNDGA